MVAPVVDQHDVYFTRLALNGRHNVIGYALTVVSIQYSVPKRRVNIGQARRLGTSIIATAYGFIVRYKVYNLLGCFAHLFGRKRTPHVEVYIGRNVTTLENEAQWACGLCLYRKPIKAGVDTYPKPAASIEAIDHGYILKAIFKKEGTGYAALFDTTVEWIAQGIYQGT